MASSAALDVGVWLLIVLYVVLCPFTKVEESFNLQATHDLIYLQTDLDHYDHHEFPGVVPRTFLGSIAVASFALPLAGIIEIFHLPKIMTQIAVRIVLGTFVACALAYLRRVVQQQFGHDTARWTAIISMTQFHIFFYASRTLPNTFAMILVIISLGLWLRKQLPGVIVMLAMTTVIFRGETVLLAGPLLLQAWLTGQIGFSKGVLIGLVSGIASLALTVGVDSIFWNRWLWPEGEVLFFNVILNKSSEWGTEPLWWYFTNALPKSLLVAFVCAPLGVLYDRRVRFFMLPMIIFVGLYSLLPHKELRFILPVLPAFNIAAASFISKIEHDGLAKPNRRAIFVFFLLLGLASCAASAGLVYISHHNYPGGHALLKLHQLEPESERVSVHIDVATAMTGASRFGQMNPLWRYSKNETHQSSAEYQDYTHLLTERPDAHQELFQTVFIQQGYSRIRRGTGWPLQWVKGFVGRDNLPQPASRALEAISIEIEFDPKIYIMRRH